MDRCSLEQKWLSRVMLFTLLSDLALLWEFLFLLKKLSLLSCGCVCSRLAALNCAVANSSARDLLGTMPFCVSWLLRPKYYTFLLQSPILLIHQGFALILMHVLLSILYKGVVQQIKIYYSLHSKFIGSIFHLKNHQLRDHISQERIDRSGPNFTAGTRRVYHYVGQLMAEFLSQ